MTSLSDESRRPSPVSQSVDGDTMASELDATPLPPGALQFRCPRCHGSAPLPAGTSLEHLTCPLCGSTLGSMSEDPPAWAGNSSAGLEPGRSLGHFTLLERLGAGAFGEVWKARDEHLDRLVAVKFPHRGRLISIDTEKFLREARAAAQLEHPHIVGVHEIGVIDGSVYIVSDFVQGVSLDKWLASRRPSCRDAAVLCAELADALEHAHQHGVIHRDLKPSNVMMDGADKPHILDFGLARRDAGEVTMTAEGQILGTPAYMSPQQARGESHTVDHRTDLYSLGVILFELLTGEMPFRGSVQMLLKQVIEDDPPSPRKLDAHVPRDLETICLKCLDKEPGRRYGSARGLAEELRRFLAGMPIQARRVTRLERCGRWCRRNPFVAASAAFGLVCLVFGAITLAVSYVRVSRALERTQRAQSRAESSLTQTRQAVDELFTRVSEDDLLNQPGMQRLRHDLLLRARDHYEKMLEHGGDEPVRDELALAHFRVGLITEAIESPSQAWPSFATARDIQTQLSAAEPDNLTRLQSLGNTLNAMGRCLDKQQRSQQALQCYRQAADVRRRLAELAPSRAEFRRTLANTCMNIGLAEQATDPGRARSSMEQAQTIRQSLLEQGCQDPKLRRDLALGYCNLATLAVTAQDYQAAEVSLQKAGELFAEACCRDSHDLEAAYQLAVCFRRQADVQAARNRPDDALQLYARARELMTPLAEKNSSVGEYQLGLAEVHINLAQAEFERGSEAGTIAAFEKAAARLTPLMTDYTEDPRYGHDLLVTLRALAIGHPQERGRQEALEALLSWEQRLSDLAARSANSSAVQSQLQATRAVIDELRSQGPPASPVDPAGTGQ